MSEIGNVSAGNYYGTSSVERITVPAPAQAASTSPDILKQAVSTTKDIQKAELQGQSFTVGEEQLIKAIEKANKALEGVATTFEFSIHDKTKQILVKVVEKDTGKLIREIPPEKILDMVAYMVEKAGLLIDEKR